MTGSWWFYSFIWNFSITIRAFIRRFYPKRLTWLIHTLTHRRQSQPCKVTASSSGAVRVKCLAQGHNDTQLGGAGDRTSHPIGFKRTALPPELSPTPCSNRCCVLSNHLTQIMGVCSGEAQSSF